MTRDAVKQVAEITQPLGLGLGGFRLEHDHQPLEDAFTECRRVFARNRRHLKRSDRARLDKLLRQVDDRDLAFQTNADEEEWYDALARRRADKHGEFIRAFSKALDHVAHPGLRDKDLPPD